MFIQWILRPPGLCRQMVMLGPEQLWSSLTWRLSATALIATRPRRALHPATLPSAVPARMIMSR